MIKNELNYRDCGCKKKKPVAKPTNESTNNTTTTTNTSK